MKQTLVIGSRGSQLALTQTRLIQSELQRLQPSLETRVEIITTTGDVKTEPLAVIGGKGVFTKELEEALLDGRIDVAVHSLKDLPTIVPERLQIAAVGKREDARDALVIRKDIFAEFKTLAALPSGAVIGTSSTRRLAQIANLRRDIILKDLRGNVDTRIAKLDRGDYDAIVLAAAGLRRLGLGERISESLSTDKMLPSPGQGALALEIRADDASTASAVRLLDDMATRIAVTAERAFLRELGGGCQLPIAAHAVLREDIVYLAGLVADPEGKKILRDEISGSRDQAEELGRSLAAKLIAEGAQELLDGAA